jgi:16S rRNA (cytosine967-C5)-methyltransferase
VTQTARHIAVDALVRIEGGAFAHILVPQVLGRTQLAARDRAHVTELVYGTVRMQRALDYQLARVSARPLPELDAPVRAALRLGAYQLLIGVPHHAAVGETVDAVAERGRGFVNGVLRALARTGPPWRWPRGDDVTSIGVRTSHPDWVVQLLCDSFGAADALATLALADEPPPVTLRVHRGRATPEELAAELAAAGVDVEPGVLVPDALTLRHARDVGALACVQDGRATPQDQASQAVVAVLDPHPDERVLDVAAAPGGKATAIAERLDGTGLVVAADVAPGRVRTVRRAAARIGLHNVAPVVTDGRRPCVRARVFDRVLLDAPCTGLGVLRRRPDARWRVEPADVENLAALQRELLVAAADAVRPGGCLVYAVCTLSPDETTGVDAYAEEALTGFRALPVPGPPWRTHGRGALLLPSDAGTDGMFVLALQRDL